MHLISWLSSLHIEMQMPAVNWAKVRCAFFSFLFFISMLILFIVVVVFIFVDILHNYYYENADKQYVCLL
jgi:hypothetical protein